MALWLTRSGSHGEHEAKFLEDDRIYLTWKGLNRDLEPLTTREELADVLEKLYPENKKHHRIQNAGQIWAFAKKMKRGDWVAVPSKRKTIHLGEITGEYQYDPKAPSPYNHYRSVKWLEEDIPRTNFDQDILNSLGAFTTICEIKRNDAEERVRSMKANQWRSTGIKAKPIKLSGDEEPTEEGEASQLDLEQIGRDHIARLIQAKFVNHRLEEIVDAILNAQGFTTQRSPNGPDGGVDILAAPGTLGFGHPRICVQVKSQSSPIERPVFDQLMGAMQNVGADQGLLVCWGGWKATVSRDAMPRTFFKVRMWDRTELIDQLLAVYDKLDAELRAEIPLKQIWAVATEDTEATE